MNMLLVVWKGQHFAPLRHYILIFVYTLHEVSWHRNRFWSVKFESPLCVLVHACLHVCVCMCVQAHMCVHVWERKRERFAQQTRPRERAHINSTQKLDVYMNVQELDGFKKLPKHIFQREAVIGMWSSSLKLEGASAEGLLPHSSTFWFFSSVLLDHKCPPVDFRLQHRIPSLCTNPSWVFSCH